MEHGEFHTLIWEFYPQPKSELITELLLTIAYEMNGFKPASVAGEALATEALRKALNAFAAQAMSVQCFCLLVNRLDLTFNIGLAGISRPTLTSAEGQWWLGDLWNCCDWCDESWTHAGSFHLHEEAARVAHILANTASVPMTLRSTDKLKY